MASTVMGARSTTNSSGFSQTGFFISEEPFQVHAGIKRRDRRSIAVEHQRPPLGEFADAAFAALAPAGMVHIGVHIGIKAVFLRVGLVPADRKSVVWGKSVSVRVDLGGRRIIKQKQQDMMRYLHD